MIWVSLSGMKATIETEAHSGPAEAFVLVRGTVGSFTLVTLSRERKTLLHSRQI